jgi:hypothetical protein
VRAKKPTALILRPYQPNAGLFPSEISVQFASSPFEYDRLLAQRGVELWAIRAPSDVRLFIYIATHG